jgi:hypothetical protein
VLGPFTGDSTGREDRDGGDPESSGNTKGATPESDPTVLKMNNVEEYEDLREALRKVAPEPEGRSSGQRFWKRSTTTDQAKLDKGRRGRVGPATTLMPKDSTPTRRPTENLPDKEPIPQVSAKTGSGDGQPPKHVNFAGEQLTRDASPLGKGRAAEEQPSKPITERERRSKDQEKGGPANEPLPKEQQGKGILEKDGPKPESGGGKNLDKTSSVNWLKHEDMLPKEHPEARVLRFGYPTTTSPDGPQKVLQRAAKELRSLLLEKREYCPNRPIVFIGNDFGVVVIELALMQEDEGKPIMESTAGIIFLATSSRSSDSGDYFADRDFSFGPKGGTIFAQSAQTLSNSHLRNFRNAVEQKNLFLARLQCANKFPNPNDIKYLQVLGLISWFAASHRFLVAVTRGNRDEVSRLLSQGVDSNVQNRKGRTALHIAVQNDQISLVRLLLGKGSAAIALQDNKGFNALHFAVEKGSVECVRLLLEKGADAKVRNKEGHSAIDLAEHYPEKADIQSLFQNRPLVEGPSGSTEKEWTMPTPPTDPKRRHACTHFRATLAEFFLIGGKEKRNLEKHSSVFDVLYGQGPESILDDVRDSGVTEKPTCRWFHIPANNVRGISR